jgi:hypothetical protein
MDGGQEGPSVLAGGLLFSLVLVDVDGVALDEVDDVLLRDAPRCVACLADTEGAGELASLDESGYGLRGDCQEFGDFLKSLCRFLHDLSFSFFWLWWLRSI